MKANMKPALQAKQPESAGGNKKSCLSEIQRLQKDRDERRKNMEQAKMERAAEEQRNRESGTPGDVDFQRMIRQFREQGPAEKLHVKSNDKICICVRKRPTSAKEIKRFDHDSITCYNPVVAVHDCKLKVDGISKYLDNNLFEMDHTFHEDNTTDDIYIAAIEPLVDFVLDGGRATVFAYGQTGSGKTYTMQGIQSFISDDLYKEIDVRNANISVTISFFEIYGGRCQDLLNERQRLNVREDGSGEVVVSDLLESEAASAEELRAIIDTGNRNRTTHATESNDESSRSHAICQISLKDHKNKELGRLSLIDLAGSERGADTKSHNRQRRMEGAEINKSLLALKECIRALGANSSHIPYRASKLTLVLKDSFTRQKSRTVMIATISPAASSADHTINTLRYADRIKERAVNQNQNNNNNNQNNNNAQNSSPVPSSSNANNAGSNANVSRNSPQPMSSRSSPTPPNNNNSNSSASSSAASGAGGKPSSLLPPTSSRQQAKDSSVNESKKSAGGSNIVSKNNQVVASGTSDAEPKSSARSNGSSVANSSRTDSKSTAVSNNGSGAKATASAANQQRGTRGGGVASSGNRDMIDNVSLPTPDNNYDFDSNNDDDNNDNDDDDWNNNSDGDERNDLNYSREEEEFHKTVQSLFEEEEELLNLHMNMIQENAELLTEEGRLLQQMQTDDYDIDTYAAKLDFILVRKQELILVLREKLGQFRKQLVREETMSLRVRGGR